MVSGAGCSWGRVETLRRRSAKAGGNRYQASTALRGPWLRSVRSLAARIPRRWPLGRTALRSYITGEYFATGAMNVVGSVVGGASGVVLARVLGARTRGELVIAITWPTFASSLACLGLTQATCFHIARADRSDRSSILVTAVGGSVALGIVLAVGGVAAAPLIFAGGTDLFWLRVVFIAQPLTMGSGVCVAALQGLSIGRWNTVRMCQLLAYFLSVLVLALTRSLTLGSAVLALIVSLMLQVVAAGFFLYPLIGRWRGPTWSWLRTLLSYGLRVVTSGASWLVNAQMDRLILSMVVSSAALANYVVAVSFSQLTLPLATAFGAVAFPRIAASVEPGSGKAVQRTVLLGGFAATIVVLVPLVIIAPWVIPLLFGKGYGRALLAFWLLAPGAVAFAMNYVLSDVLRGWGRPLAPTVAESIAAVATIALLAVLVPALGIDGASIASSIAYGVGTVVLWHALFRAKGHGPPSHRMAGT